MRALKFSAHRHGIRLVVLAAAMVAAASCGSSTAVSTAPGTITRCAVVLEQASSSTVPATGGTGSVVVKTERECQWTASTEGGWLSITGGAAGQGEGTLQFSAAPNADPITRSGAIVANGQRSAISQAAAECRFELAESSASFPATGGSGTVQVRASSALCTWSVIPGVGWISAGADANGRGTAPASFSVAPNTGPERSGTLVVAGVTFTVSQSAQGTTPTPTPVPTPVPGPTPGPTPGPGPTPNPPAPTPPTPTPPSPLPTPNPPTPTPPSPSCSYRLSKTSNNEAGIGGSGAFDVIAPAGCAWTAVSNAPWITIASGANGSGNGAVWYAAARNTGGARTGTITVAGITFTVNQEAAPPCSYALGSTGQDVNGSGGGATVAVTAGPGCGWTSSSNAPWISISSGASGSGNGSVQLSVAANPGPARNGTVTIAGQTFTVRQASAPCSFSIGSTEQSVDGSGGGATVAVTAGQGCAWTAASNAPWIAVTSGASGNGNGSVQITVAANTEAARTGTVTIAGQTFTVRQAAAPCSFAIGSTEQAVDGAGGAATVSVTAGQGCAWSATSNAPWITVTAGANGVGNGSVQLAVAGNPEGARTGTVTIAGQTFTVRQGGAPCSFAITPANTDVGAEGASPSVSVTAGASCAWTAASQAPWIAVSSGASGTGNGTVQLVVSNNPDAARAGTVTIAGQAFTVRQAGAPCSFAIAPADQDVAAEGGNSTVAVTAGAACAWTATSNAPWLSIGSGGSGTGNGSVGLIVAANGGAARTGTATIAGHTFTVRQAGAPCSFAVERNDFTVDEDGADRTLDVTAGAGCAWTAVSNVPWIQITRNPAGTGPARVEFHVDRNPDEANRQGTLTVAGFTITVTQRGDDDDEL